MRFVVVFRGVFLYGESGSGKSSLVNAGLIRAAALEGFRADRLRVQPRRGEELVVERIPVSEDADSFLPSSFAADGDSSRIVLPVDTLPARLAAISVDDPRPLLIFDQFEELITLFEEAPDDGALEEALRCQRSIVDVLVQVLRDETLRVKLLFGFREDYLAKVKKLLDRCPELVGQSVLLTPPGTEALLRIIRGPFEEYPGRFERELSLELAERLSAAIEGRSGSGGLSLSEVQIVCLRLWESRDPMALLEEKGVEGILEAYLEESVRSFPEELHDPAVALLSQMVTGTGARNVISADDLIERVRAEEPDIPEERLARTLDALERETRLVRRERRRDLDLYEISSEFLVPWIGRQREDRSKARERAALERQLEDQRRHQRATYQRAVGASVLLLLSIVLGAVAVYGVFNYRNERDKSQSRLVAQEAVQLLDSNLEAAVTRALRAWDIDETGEAEEALRSALVQSRRRGVLRGPGRDALLGASFNPTGTQIVTTRADGTTRIWDATTGKPLTALGKAGGRVNSATFNPYGTHVVTASTDGTARVWDASTWTVVITLGSRGGSMYSATFSHDGTKVLTASADGVARIWDLATRKAIELRGHTASVNGASFSPLGTQVVTASSDGTARVWDVATGRAFVLRGHKAPVLGASFNPDGTQVATASADRTARVWDVATGKAIELRGHKDFVYGASFSPDGTRVVTASADRTARVWDLATRKAFVLGGHTQSVSAAAFSPDGTRIVTASADATARVWDSGVVRSEMLFSRGGKLDAAAVSPDGRFIAAVGDGTAQMWSARSQWTGGVSLGKADTILSASFSPDSRRLVTASTDGIARIWNTLTVRPTRELPRREALQSASFDPGGKLVAVVWAGASIFDGETGRVRAEITRPGSPVVSAAFSADGKHLVTVTEGDMRLSDAQTGAQLAILPLRPRARPVDVAFSPGGLLVTAYDDGKATIWNVEDALRPREVAELRGHTKRINSVGFSPDGKFIVTASDDGTARVWEAGSGRLLAVLGHRRPVRIAVLSEEFTPDGKLAVLTASGDGAVRLYSCEACLPIDELIRLGNWTEEELAGKTRSGP